MLPSAFEIVNVPVETFCLLEIRFTSLSVPEGLAVSLNVAGALVPVLACISTSYEEITCLSSLEMSVQLLASGIMSTAIEPVVLLSISSCVIIPSPIKTSLYVVSLVYSYV